MACVHFNVFLNAENCGFLLLREAHACSFAEQGDKDQHPTESKPCASAGHARS